MEYTVVRWKYCTDHTKMVITTMSNFCKLWYVSSARVMLRDGPSAMFVTCSEWKLCVEWGSTNTGWHINVQTFFTHT